MSNLSVRLKKEPKFLTREELMEVVQEQKRRESAYRKKLEKDYEAAFDTRITSDNE